MIERILLVMNRSAGTSYSNDAVHKVQYAATELLGENSDLQVEVVGDHSEVTACTTAFLAASHTPAWIRDNMREDGLLVTDSFTADAYALSGRYVGYKAHYYPPDVYKMLMDYCGFDGLNATVKSGRDAINHVMLFSPRKLDAEDAALPEDNNDNHKEE